MDTQSHSAETEDYLNLYSSTLRSLVSDAEAIRQISDMADLVQQGDDAVAEDLVQLDNMVSKFEHKVAVLRQILNEEKNALIQFETNLREEADDQKALIEGLMAALQLKENDENQQQQIQLEQLQTQQQQQQVVEDEPEPAETSLSFSSLGDSTIRNSYRQSLLSAQHGYDLDGDSWDEENLPQQPNQSQPLARTSTGSSGSGSITIKSNESGSFTRRNGLLKSTRFSNNTNQNNNANSKSNASPYSSSRSSTTKVPTTRKRTVNFVAETNNHSHSGRSTHRSSTRDQENTPSQQSQKLEKPTFVPVTDQELAKQRVHGPHMCRYDINDALEEIQTIVWNQMQLAENNSSRRSSNSNSRRQYTYQKYQQRNDTDNNDNHSSHHRYSVSEQELRENCAFFRHGESTARATLQLLCSLKRLKQVPSKKSQVTYICLFGVWSSDRYIVRMEELWFEKLTWREATTSIKKNQI